MVLLRLQGRHFKKKSQCFKWVEVLKKNKDRVFSFPAVFWITSVCEENPDSYGENKNNDNTSLCVT